MTHLFPGRSPDLRVPYGSRFVPLLVRLFCTHKISLLGTNTGWHVWSVRREARVG